jgi:hypothetical protein
MKYVCIEISPPRRCSIPQPAYGGVGGSSLWYRRSISSPNQIVAAVDSIPVGTISDAGITKPPPPLVRERLSKVYAYLPPPPCHRGHIIEAPGLVNGGHGASLRHHNDSHLD